MSSAIASIDAWGDWSAFPASWPKTPGASVPLGLVRLNGRIRQTAEKRLETIRRDMQNAGQYYPRQDIAAALAYWEIDLQLGRASDVGSRSTQAGQEPVVEM